MRTISNHEPQQRRNTRFPLSPTSKWELELYGEEWLLYPPGNNPHFALGQCNERDAHRIGKLVEQGYELGKHTVQNAITDALGMRKAW